MGILDAAVLFWFGAEMEVCTAAAAAGHRGTAAALRPGSSQGAKQPSSLASLARRARARPSHCFAESEASWFHACSARPRQAPPGLLGGPSGGPSELVEIGRISRVETGAGLLGEEPGGIQKTVGEAGRELQRIGSRCTAVPR